MHEAAITERIAPAPEASVWREFWQAYSQSRGALIGLALVIALILLAVFADVVSPHPPNEQYREFTLTPPAWHEGGTANFILGTDPVGRDILSRLIHGTRLSLLIGVISVAISLSLGVVLGLAAGYFRGLTETTIMRLMDVMLSLPSLNGDDGDRHRAAAALRAPDSRRGDRRNRQGVRRFVAYRRRRSAAADVQYDSAQLRRPADRAGHTG